jgi:predicted DCC family thiol-disulfide oxidoreductase YuxK
MGLAVEFNQMNSHLVLWDGDCGFCGRAVAWLQQKDQEHRFEFLRYQDAPSPPMTPELFRACSKAVHVIERDGPILKGGRAMLFILEKEGVGPIARFLAFPPFIWLVELGYYFVAGNRSMFSRFFFRRAP